MTVAGIVVLLTAVAIRLEWWWGLRGAAAHSGPATEAEGTGASSSPQLPVGISVVVALRNEAENVDGLVEALLRQHVPPGVELEFVLVDDSSTDATQEHLQAWSARDPRIRVLASGGDGKKAALTAGIGAARFERLAFTDADARPGPGWLGALAAQSAAAPRAVFIGQAPLTAEAPATLLGRYQRYDALLTDLWAAAAVGRRRPFLAKGANLSFPKSLFIAVGGFGTHAQTLSGSDDLFVQQVARTGAAPILSLQGEEAHVPSPAQNTFRAWWHQKRRHLSAGRHYPVSAHLRLALWHGVDLAAWVLPVLALNPALVAVPLVVVAVHAAVLFREGRRRDRDLIPWLPVLAPLLVLYNLVVPLTIFIRPPKKWKA